MRQRKAYQRTLTQLSMTNGSNSMIASSETLIPKTSKLNVMEGSPQIPCQTMITTVGIIGLNLRIIGARISLFMTGRLKLISQ